MDLSRFRTKAEVSAPIASASGRFIVACHSAVLILGLLFPAAALALVMQPSQAFGKGKLWRLVTGILVQDTSAPWQACAEFALLAFFVIILCRGLEQAYKPWDIIYFYFTGGLVASIIWSASLAGWPAYEGQMGWEYRLRTHPGPSALALLLALHFPGRPLLRWFPVPCWTVVFVYPLVEIVFFSPDPWSAPMPAHVGAWLFALLFRQFDLRASTLRSWLQSRWRRKKAVAPPLQPPTPNREADAAFLDDANEQMLDRILAKIGDEGIDSLTAEERQWLENASKRLRRPPPHP